MDCAAAAASSSPYQLILTAALQIPIAHFFLGLALACLVFVYNFLEIHILRDLFTGFRGQPVVLTFNPSSELYQQVVSRCRVLHGRYLSTPWLSSPHLQTSFLSLYSRPLGFSYRRQLFRTADGGTLALDWLRNSDVLEDSFEVGNVTSKDDKTPILIVVPGLTSDSESSYIKHFTYKMAKSGWNVVISNHRGLGGVSLTSDCCYNAGWTEDLRKVVDHVHCQYPEALLFVAGCSLGANVVVKYLGEDGINTPIAGAAVIGCPWDLLVCDRFLNRKPVQHFYNKALVIGLKDYAQLHQTVVSRVADWEGIGKSRVLRDFDNHLTRVAAKFETVDTYYRRCSSCNYVGDVMVPLLCISAIDDPVCTGEALPFDECRANKNIVLAATQHGGHLAYYEGMTANSLWWVRAVHEFLIVLESSALVHRKKEVEMQIPPTLCPQESAIDQGPYVNIMEDGMVTAVGDDQITKVEDTDKEPLAHPEKKQNMTLETHQSDHITEERDSEDTSVPVRRFVDQLSRHSRKSVWLLAYIAIMTTWPLVGSGIAFFWQKRFTKRLPALRKL